METTHAVPTLEQQALSWPNRARAISVHNQLGYEAACNMLKGMADLEAEIKAHHKPIKEAADRTHKTAVAAEKRLLDPVGEAKIILKHSISSWEIAQESKRQELQRLSDEAARKSMEDMALAQAIEVMSAGGSEEEADAILDEKRPLPSIIAAPTFQRQSGVSTRKTWKWRIIDYGQIPHNLMKPDEVKITAYVRAMGQSANIPGIEIYEDTSITVRR